MSSKLDSLYRLVAETGPAKIKLEEAMDWLFEHLDGHPKRINLITDAAASRSGTPLTIAFRRNKCEYNHNCHSIDIDPHEVVQIARSVGFEGTNDQLLRRALAHELGHAGAPSTPALFEQLLERKEHLQQVAEEKKLWPWERQSLTRNRENVFSAPTDEIARKAAQKYARTKGKVDVAAQKMMRADGEYSALLDELEAPAIRAENAALEAMELSQKRPSDYMALSSTKSLAEHTNQIVEELMAKRSQRSQLPITPSNVRPPDTFKPVRPAPRPTETAAPNNTWQEVVKSGAQTKTRGKDHPLIATHQGSGRVTVE